jgi:uncharacterized glyoxalase superfamily protein PhnB
MPSNTVPCLRYRDAATAIAWLCNTLGFERQLVVPGEGDEIAHAQLKLGQGLVMLGSVRDTPYGRLMRQPDEAGGCTQSVYLVVDDVDAVYARAKAAGARIALDIKTDEQSGRGFSCHDPEGHLWNLGNYDPWATASTS